MADDKKRRKKAAEPPKNDNNQEPPKVEQPADDNTGKSPRELWNDIPAADKEKIKAGEVIFDADEELADEELAKHIFEGLEAEAQSLTEKVNKLTEAGINAGMSEYRKSLNKLTNTLKDLTAGYLEAVKITNTIPALDAIQELIDSILSNDALQQYIADYKQLKPYIDAELRKPKYKHRTFAEITSQEWQEIETAAREAFAAAGNKNVPSVRAKEMEFFHLPLTKQHNDIFTNLLLSDADKNSMPGQLVFANALAVEKKKDKPRTVFYTIGVPTAGINAKLSRALSNKEQRVHDAIGSLKESGNHIVTTQQLYLAMGNKGNCNARQRDEIIRLLKRIAGTWVKTDQTQDYSDYIDPTKGKLGLKVEEQLLYIKIAEAYINGKLVKDAIYIMETPVLFQLAKDRKQITPIPLEVIATGESQTEDQLGLENYLLGRISQMKNSKRKSSKKILYSSIYEALGITGTSDADRKRITRTNTKILKTLDTYKEKKWIKGYKEMKSPKGELEIEIFC